MAEEWQEINCLPYRRRTIETLIKFSNKKLNLNIFSISFDYTYEVSSVLKSCMKR